MKTEKQIFYTYIDVICNDVANKTVWHLKRIKEHLSGCDSSLSNAWEEICVQVRGEKYFQWEIYEVTAKGIIQGFTEEMNDSLKRLIWFKSDDELGEENDGLYDESAVIEHIYQRYLLQLADTYTNPGIEKELNRFILD